MPISAEFQEGLVSVIIPSFNRAKYIDQTIDSVLTQDYDNVELIVVDDGSNDGSYELLRKYEADGHLMLLTHPNRENKGQSASINRGLHAARGEYIAVLDSDDLFAPGKLRKQVKYLQQHRDTGLVYGMGQAVCAEGKYLYDILGPDHVETNEPGAILLDCYFLLPQNSLVRRSVYEKAGLFEESFRAAQDHDMLVRMSEVTKFGFIPELVFFYRRHGDSISANGQERRWRTGFEILARAEARYPYPRSVIRRRAAVLNFRMGQVHLRAKRPIRALPRLIKSVLLDLPRAFRMAVSFIPRPAPVLSSDAARQVTELSTKKV